MGGADDVALHFVDDSEIKKRHLKHPKAVFFHLLFRVSAVLVYLFCGWFSNSFISCFVSIILLLSLDFWTVKNVTGRLLAGLRWWNYIDDNGKSHWVFESRKPDDMHMMDAAEAQVFWVTLVVFPLLWVILMFVSIFRLNFRWFIIVCIGIILHGANLYGYIRCNTGKSFAGSFTFSLLRSEAVGKLLPSFLRKSSNKPSGLRQPFSSTV